MIDAARLIAAGIAPAQANAWASAIAIACEHFLINTPARVSGFIAQCRVESSDFTAVVEDMRYTHAERIAAVFPSKVPTLAAAQPLVNNPQALANTVYAGRLGNGDVASGDGWAFRGRGLAQLTGRAAYMTAGVALLRPYTAQPDLVAQPSDAALVAAWYWKSNNCNAMADCQDWNAITRIWNGKAMLKAAERAQLSRAGLAIFTDH